MDTDEKAFEHILLGVVERLKAVRKSHAFHHPVDRRKVKGYYLKINHPMDLSTMERKAKSHDYHSAAEFLADVELIYRNSEAFNGPASVYTSTAKELYDFASKCIQEVLIRVAGHFIIKICEKLSNFGSFDQLKLTFLTNYLIGHLAKL